MTRKTLAAIARAASAALALGGFALAQVQEALPVCNNNGPYVAECTGQLTPVPITSAGSFDADGPVTFLWFEECPWGFVDDPTAPDANMIIDLLGTCSKTCVLQLRVFQGGQQVSCNTTVTVQDTTPPVITCPADFTEIWNGGIAAGQIDPAHTGSATAIDCDPNPTIGFTDLSTIPNTSAGQPELVVTRQWTATDNCLNTSTCQQIITLLSPSLGSALGGLLDVAPGSCSNEVSANATDGLFNVLLLGTAQFDVSQIDRATIELRRMDNLGTPAKRAITKLLDKARPGPANSPNCSQPLKDGKLDMQLSFPMQDVTESLNVAKEALGSQVNLAVTGRMVDGRWFVIRDVATVVQ